MTQGREQTQEWSDMQEKGTFLGLSIMLWIYKIFGVKAMYFTLYFVVAFFFVGSKASRHASLDYLRHMHAFLGKRSPWDKTPGLALSFRHFMIFAQMACDKVIVWLEHYKPEDIVLHGYDQYKALQEKGQGCLLLVSHLGNIDLCRAFAGGFKHIPLTILVHNGHAPNFFRLMQKVTKRETTIDLVEVKNITPDVIIRLREVIANGGNVAIAADRTAVESEGRVEHVTFLEADTAFAQGPFILADLLDCPVQTVFALKDNDGVYHAHFDYVADSLKVTRKDRPVALKNNIQNYAKTLEKYACAYPLQWFNFYDYWADKETKQ